MHPVFIPVKKNAERYKSMRKEERGKRKKRAADTLMSQVKDY
jgi:hypothetical protein